MNRSFGKLAILATLAALPLVATTAQGETAVGQITGFSVLGRGQGRELVLPDDAMRIEAGAPLRIELGGTPNAKCSVRVQVTQAPGTAVVFNEDLELSLGKPHALRFNPGPYGNFRPGSAHLERYSITVQPVLATRAKHPCRGVIQGVRVESVCRGRCVAWDPSQLPRINLGPLVLPTRPTNTAPSATPSSTPSSSNSTTPPAPAVPAIPSAKPATGSIATLSVPGGSFAEDETQKLALTGTGGCAFDLHVSNKTYGGSFDKTFATGPLNLSGGPSLYNGTHFDTLAEGSYHADVTGKSGCTGQAAIDFKVTAKTSTQTIKGQPTLTLDKKPIAGSAFTRSKDSNIWFKVAVPSSFSGPYTSCCEVEYDYINEYGGWEVLPNSPFNNPSFNPKTNANSAVPKSVSGFTVPGIVATRWRMRVRGYQYKVTFEWSDWLEFSVDRK